jgi:hypothetical protein
MPWHVCGGRVVQSHFSRAFLSSRARILRNGAELDILAAAAEDLFARKG